MRTVREVGSSKGGGKVTFCESWLRDFLPESQLRNFPVLRSPCAADQTKQLHMWSNNPQAVLTKRPQALSECAIDISL